LSKSARGKEVRLVALKGEVFKCILCGNTVEVIQEGGNPEIACCGQSMERVS